MISGTGGGVGACGFIAVRSGSRVKHGLRVAVASQFRVRSFDWIECVLHRLGRDAVQGRVRSEKQGPFANGKGEPES